MKTLKRFGVALMAILIGISFASCGDVDNGDTNGGGGVGSKKLVKVYGTDGQVVENYTFSYDEKGRVIQATEEYRGEENDVTTYQFTWSDSSVMATRSDGRSATLTLNEGLVRSCDFNDVMFTYNQTPRLARIESRYEIEEITWEGYKLMSVSSSEKGSDIQNLSTFSYNGSCQKGYFPFMSMLADLPWYMLFMANPELAGIRTNQLPAKITKKSGHSNWTETMTLTYELDKEGYISKIKLKEEGATYTLTWR